MEFKFYCPKCGQHIAASTDQIGTRAMCPTCTLQFNVPSLEPNTPDQERRRDPVGPSSRAQSESRPEANAPAPTDDWKSVGPWLQVLGTLLVIALVIGGIALLCTGIGMPFGLAALFAARLVFIGIKKMMKT